MCVRQCAPMRRLLPRAVAVATILLVLLAVTVLALRGTGVGIALGPLVSPTPAARATPPASTAGSPSPGNAQLFGQIETQVRALRGLAAPNLAAPDIVTRAQLEAELRGRFDRDYPPARRAADNVLLRALGLLTPAQDIGELQLRLLSGQVIGFYDDRTKHLTLVSDSGIGPGVKITYAHEYTHALQDKAFRLASLQLYAVGEDDRVELQRGEPECLVLQRVRVLVGVGDLHPRADAAVADEGQVLGPIVVEADDLSAQQPELQLADVLRGRQQSKRPQQDVVGRAPRRWVVAVKAAAELRLQL